MKINNEIKEIFKLVKDRIGGGIRTVQITDEALCSLLDMVFKDYMKEVQQFIVKSQWVTLYGKNIHMSPQDLAYALTTRTLDYATDFSYWFSKEVGLQQRGTKFELKKDFFQIEKGKQCYLVEKGREIQRVMWCTPSTTKAAMYTNMGMIQGFGNNLQLGNVGMVNGLNSFYFGNMYDIALTSANLKYANSMLRGDLAYKVTAGPDGTHIIHLMSTPGSTNAYNGIALDDSLGGWKNYVGCYVWYTYYDTTGASQDEIDDCRIANSDIIISPETVPLNQMQWDYLNEPAKTTIRQLFIAETMITVGLVRGYASGKISIGKAEMNLDYNMLLDMGKNEKKEVLDDLKKYLEELLPINIIKNQAEITENLNKILGYKPLGLYVR